MLTPFAARSWTRRAALRSGGRALAWAGAVALLQACAATGQAPSTASSSAAQAAATTTGQTAAVAHAGASPATAAAQSPAGTVAISWLVPEDPLLGKFANDGIAPAFQQANPAIKVTVISPGQTSYGEKLLALVAGGTPPTVFTDWGGASFFTLWNRKLLTDLSTYLGQAHVNTDFLLPLYVKQYTVDGKLYAIPWNSNPNFIAYNKTLFEKYSVPLPPIDWNDKSWTTDKLVQTAQSLTHDTGDPTTSIFGLTMGTGTCGSLAWLWNSDPFNNTGGPEDSSVYHGTPLTAVYATRQGMVDAMGWRADLMLKYRVFPTGDAAKAITAQHGLFSGRLGMVQQAGGWLERGAAAAQPNFSWGIAPFPYGPGGRNTMQREDNAWYLCQQAKNLDAGFQLTIFAVRGKGADDLISYAKDNPPLADTSYLGKWAQDILKIPGFAMSQDDFVSVFEGGIKAGFGDPTNIIDNASQFGSDFTDNMDAVWTGQKTPLTALQSVQAKWEGDVKQLVGR